jgi:hypothetical protein
MSSTTQQVKGKLEFDAILGDFRYSYYLGFPFDYQLLARNDSLMYKGPLLLLHICSMDEWDRFTDKGILPKLKFEFRLRLCRNAPRAGDL